MPLVGGTQLAKTLGTTPQAITNAVASGRLSVAEKGGRGALFDVDTATQEWNKSRAFAEAKAHNPKRKPCNSSDNVLDQGKAEESNEAIRKARGRKLSADAKMAELNVKVRAGKLIEKQQAFQDGVDLGAVLLGALQAWPSRLAPEFVSMRDATEHGFYVRLTKECNELIVSIRTLLNLE